MIFKDSETLTSLYESVVKNNAIIEEAMKCKCSKNSNKKCTCKEKPKKVEEAKKAKPDYFDVDKDGNKKESMKKALKDKKHVKENISSFKALYQRVIAETKSA
jgi:hypothetical protein